MAKDLLSGMQVEDIVIQDRMDIEPSGNPYLNSRKDFI